MIKRKKLKRYFSIGPIGALFTVAIWATALALEKVLKIPQMSIHPFLRTVLIIIFSTDALYLLIGSNYQLRKHRRGNVLVAKGPYQFIRHPIYSVWIYSFAGILAMVMFSWAIIIAVFPINLFWSWLVTFEENNMLGRFKIAYQDYMANTGQFLPSWKAMKDSIDQNK